MSGDPIPMILPGEIMHAREPIALVPGKSDAELAAEFKRRAADALEPLCRLCDEARDAGFDLGFQLGQMWNGKTGIAALSLMKRF